MKKFQGGSGAEQKLSSKVFLEKSSSLIIKTAQKRKRLLWESFSFWVGEIEQGKGSGKPRFSRGGIIQTEGFEKRAKASA